MVSLPTGSDDIGSVSGFGANENEMNHFRVKSTRFIFFQKIFIHGIYLFPFRWFQRKKSIANKEIKWNSHSNIHYPYYSVKTSFCVKIWHIVLFSMILVCVCVFWLKCMVGIPNTQKMVDVSSLASSSFFIYFADFPVNDLKVNHHCTSLN